MSNMSLKAKMNKVIHKLGITHYHLFIIWECREVVNHVSLQYMPFHCTRSL